MKMETKPGYIRIGIDKKVYFEPDGLPKPKHNPSEYSDLGILTFKLRKAWEAYKASKQLIEVENVVPHLMPRLNEQKVDVYYDVIFSDYNFEQIKNNQPCTASIKDNKATII